MTKQEVKEIAPASPLPGFTPSPGTVVPTDTIKQAIEKLDANNTQVTNNITRIASNIFQTIM